MVNPVLPLCNRMYGENLDSQVKNQDLLKKPSLSII